MNQEFQPVFFDFVRLFCYDDNQLPQYLLNRGAIVLKESVLRIPTLHTFENPIRTVAWANQGIWVEQVQKPQEDDFECAMYYKPYTNQVYPETVDAIFVEITFSHNRYHVSGFAVIPDEERAEIRIDEYHTNYSAAKQNALFWLQESQKFVVLQQSRFAAVLPQAERLRHMN